MMRGIMGQVVGQVPDHETRGERRYPLRRLEQDGQDQVEQPEENEEARDTDRERHDQAGLHLRLGVVDAVEQEEDALLARTGWLVMEQEAVQGIFGQRPQEEAEQEAERNMGRKAGAGGIHQRVDDQEDRNRQPHEDNGHRADVSEIFHKVGLEQADGFRVPPGIDGHMVHHRLLRFHSTPAG